MRLLENDIVPKSGKKYAYLEAYMSGPASCGDRAPTRPPPPLLSHFFEKLCQRKIGRKKERKNSDLPVSQMRFQICLSDGNYMSKTSELAGALPP